MRHDLQLVRRSRVVEAIRKATESPLTIVQAPFGYGKTVAVQQFAAATSHRVIWIEAGSLHGSPLPRPGAVAASGEPTLLVLEDLHHVDDHAALAQLAHLVETAPPHVRLLVTSRRPVDLPVARWRTQGLVGEVGTDELGMLPSEVAEGLDLDLGSPAAVATAHRLAERSEGWVAGVQLLARSPEVIEHPDAPLDPVAGRWLLDQALADQPDEVREFLVTTSILHRFCAELCRVVTRSLEAGSFLDRVHHDDLFLVALDDEQEWFRYQRLFAELLRLRLHERDDETVRPLHGRAARWFLDHDEPDAVGHLVAAGEGEHALDLLAADVEFMSREDAAHGVDWRTVFPPRWIEQTPARMIYVAAVLTRTGWVDDAARWLDDAERALRGHDPRDPDHVLLASARAVWLAARGDPDMTLKVGKEALDLLDDPTADPASRRLLMVVATAHVLVDELDEAEALCATLDDPRAPEVIRGVAVPAIRSRLAERRGHLGEAEALARQAMGTAEALGLPFHSSIRGARVALARVLAERGDFAEAEALLLGTISMYEERNWTAGVTVARVELAWVRAAWSGSEAGLAAAENVRGSTPQQPLSPAVRMVLDRVEARLRLDVGDVDGAAALIEEMRPGTDRDLLRVSLALQRQEVQQAADLLASIPPTTLRTQIATELLAAQVAAARANDHNRDSHLLDAASAGLDEGFCLTFVVQAPGLLPALRALAESRRQLLPLILSLDRVQGARARPAPGPALSKRELNVLRYLPSDLTNPEIAAELDITTNTLKTHIRSLYGKLGVGSRAAAVRAARKSGLL